MRILVDTSVWVDHLRSDVPHLKILLSAGQVVMHEMIVGEIACGSLRDRTATLNSLNELASIPQLSNSDAVELLDGHELYSKGIGFVDLHLVCAALVHEMKIWTNDARLNSVAEKLGCAYTPEDS